MTTDSDPPESGESLFTLVAPPLVWAAHFLLSYGTAAVYCAKVAGPDGSLGPARAAIAFYTAAAIGAVAFLGVRGYRRQRAHGPTPTAEADASPIGRHRFLGFATLLLAGLSGLAIAYAALAVALVRSCR